MREISDRSRNSVSFAKKMVATEDDENEIEKVKHLRFGCKTISRNVIEVPFMESQYL